MSCTVHVCVYMYHFLYCFLYSPPYPLSSDDCFMDVRADEVIQGIFQFMLNHPLDSELLQVPSLRTRARTHTHTLPAATINKTCLKCWLLLCWPLSLLHVVAYLSFFYYDACQMKLSCEVLWRCNDQPNFSSAIEELEVFR